VADPVVITSDVDSVTNAQPKHAEVANNASKNKKHDLKPSIV
jgi:hypothetical protein